MKSHQKKKKQEFKHFISSGWRPIWEDNEKWVDCWDAHCTLSSDQRIWACLALSELLSTGGYNRERSWPRVWLICVLSIEIYRLYMDQRLEMLCLFLVSCQWSLLPPPSFVVGYKEVRKVNKSWFRIQYLLDFSLEAILFYILFFFHACAPFRYNSNPHASLHQ